MLKFLITFTLLFAAPMSFAKAPKCAEGDKACAKKTAKKNAKSAKKSEKKTAKKGKKDGKKTEKKTAKKNKKPAPKAKVAAKKEKKKKQVKMDMPATDVSEPMMPLPDSMSDDATAGGVDASSPAAETAAVTPPAHSTPASTPKGDLEDDIFPESSTGTPADGGAAPDTGSSSGDDFLDDELSDE